MRELRVVKVTGADGIPHYSSPDEWENTPTLASLLPTLFQSTEGVGHLLVVKTLKGGAQTVAAGIDWEEWPEVLGTLAGDDTILVVLRDPAVTSTDSRANRRKWRVNKVDLMHSIRIFMPPLRSSLVIQAANSHTETRAIT